MNTSQSKVSIILPVFNGGTTLLPAVRSIVDQSYLNWELIIVDDGSTDECIGAIALLKDPRIKVHSDGLRKGLATRLNEGIDLSIGLYIARMDADDLCFFDRIQKQVDYLDVHQEIDLVATKVVGFSMGESGLSFGALPYRERHEEISASPWGGIYMPHPSWMGRATWFRKYRYRIPEAIRAEDQELLLRAMPESRYYCLPEILLAYRQGSLQLRQSLLARRELFKCQLKIFLDRRQLGHLLRAMWLTLQKTSFDLLKSTFPRLALFNINQAEKISPETLQQFYLLLQKYEESSSASLEKTSCLSIT